MSFAFDVEKDHWFHEKLEGGEDEIEIEIREILEFAQLYDYSPVSYPAYEDTAVQARSKELALRNKPKPEASGEAGAAVLKVRQDARDNLEQIRQSNKERINQ